VDGIAVNVLAPTLQRGEPWQRLGVDGPARRRDCSPEPIGR
jgi:hypothetical protein